MIATEQYFPAVLFIMLYKVVLTFGCEENRVTIQMKATEQYFPVKVFLALSSDKSYDRVLHSGTVHCETCFNLQLRTQISLTV